MSDYADRLATYINFARLMVERDRRMFAGLQGKRSSMGRLDEFAEDVPDIVLNLEDTFGSLHERAKNLREKGEEVADKWQRHLDGRANAIAKAEAAINRIANVPLPDSKPPPTPSTSKPGESPFRG